MCMQYTMKPHTHTHTHTQNEGQWHDSLYKNTVQFSLSQNLILLVLLHYYMQEDNNKTEDWCTVDKQQFFL
jgi:hypothetical protein